MKKEPSGPAVHEYVLAPKRIKSTKATRRGGRRPKAGSVSVGRGDDTDAKFTPEAGDDDDEEEDEECVHGYEKILATIISSGKNDATVSNDRNDVSETSILTAEERKGEETVVDGSGASPSVKLSTSDQLLKSSMQATISNDKNDTDKRQTPAPEEEDGTSFGSLEMSPSSPPATREEITPAAADSTSNQSLQDEKPTPAPEEAFRC